MTRYPFSIPDNESDDTPQTVSSATMENRTADGSDVSRHAAITPITPASSRSKRPTSHDARAESWWPSESETAEIRKRSPLLVHYIGRLGATADYGALLHSHTGGFSPGIFVQTARSPVLQLIEHVSPCSLLALHALSAAA